jgi:hypothetical protein
VARAFRGGIESESGIGYKGVGQALGDGDVAHGPGSGEDGAPGKDVDVGSTLGSMTGREGLCEGIEGVDLLLVGGTLTSCTSGRESRSSTLSAVLARRQKSGYGGRRSERRGARGAERAYLVQRQRGCADSGRERWR